MKDKTYVPKKPCMKGLPASTMWGTAVGLTFGKNINCKENSNKAQNDLFFRKELAANLHVKEKRDPIKKGRREKRGLEDLEGSSERG